MSYVLNYLLGCIQSYVLRWGSSTLELFYVQVLSTFSLSTLGLSTYKRIRSVFYVASFDFASRHLFNLGWVPPSTYRNADFNLMEPKETVTHHYLLAAITNSISAVNRTSLEGFPHLECFYTLSVLNCIDKTFDGFKLKLFYLKSQHSCKDWKLPLNIS